MSKATEFYVHVNRWATVPLLQRQSYLQIDITLCLTYKQISYCVLLVNRWATVSYLQIDRLVCLPYKYIGYCVLLANRWAPVSYLQIGRLLFFSSKHVSYCSIFSNDSWATVLLATVPEGSQQRAWRRRGGGGGGLQ